MSGSFGWERLAAFEGGTVSWLTAAPAGDGTWHVFAATTVGVFRSVDGGLTWSPLGGASRVAGVEVVSPSPRYAEDGIVFAGAFDGLFRWREGGTGWEHLLSGSRVSSVACAPSDPADPSNDSSMIVLVGTGEDGVLLSRDSGRTWSGANAGLTDLVVYAVTPSPRFAEDGIAFAATSSGLYRTRNGAESWREVQVTDEADEISFESVAVSPDFAEDRTILACSYDQGVYRSDDAGRTWSPLLKLDQWIADTVFFWSGNRAGVASEMGVGLSEDGGRTWHLDWEHPETKKTQPAFCAVRLPRAPSEDRDVLLAGLHDGVARSLDEGQHWTVTNAGLNAALVTRIAISPDFELDQTLYLVNPLAGLMVSRDGGRSWTETPGPVNPASLTLPEPDPAVDDAGENRIRSGWLTPHLLAPARSPGGDKLLFGGTSRGLHLSRDQGKTWERLSLDTIYSAVERSELQELVEAVSITDAPAGPTVLVVVRTGRGLDWALGVSDDAGETWQAVDTPQKQTFARAVVLSPEYHHRDGTIYVATHRAVLRTDLNPLTLWRTRNRGQRWDRWLDIPDVPGGNAVQIVALPANQWNDTVLLGLGNSVYRPRQGSWQVLGGGRRPVWDTSPLPGEAVAGRAPALTGLVASPDYAQDRTIFAATSAGVYVSRDGGASFTPWSDGLDPVSTVVVAPSPAYARDRLVYALGLGGTVWRRRDG